MQQGAFFLEGCYDVYFGNRKTGQVQVIRQGLYYRFLCRCEISGDVICRLYVTCGENREDLGILIPRENGFGMDTKIPIKKLGNGRLHFALMAKHEKQQGRFIPIYPEEPFRYLSRLKESFLEYRNGQMGITVTAGTE